MNLNMDFSKSVVINTHELDWVDSPLPGVQRRMLERESAESGRATSIVRYAPNSYFTEHTHSGGEEFIVLDGVFSDAMGDFPKGMYVRNPIGSSHKPYTEGGATILVKLDQFDVKDQDYVRTDTTKGPWQQGDVSGWQSMALHEFEGERIELEKWAPGTRFRERRFPAGVEIYVLSGAFSDEHGQYPEGTWLRNPANSVHTPYSDKGCLIYVKTGHLAT